MTRSGPLATLRRMAKKVARLSPLGYDGYARWSWDAADAAIALGRSLKCDAVWATLSPLSLGPAAIKVARELGLPCILDLRDPPDEALQDAPRGWFAKALRSAAHVTVAAPSCITPYVSENAQPLLVLSGAWEPEPIVPQPSPQFRIVHAGTWHEHYAAAPLFEAVKQLSAELPDFAEHAKLVIVGKGSSSVESSAGFRDVALQVETHALLPHAGAVAMINSASVLLIARSSSGYKSQAITGKIFEYAPYQIPLLSIGGEDDLHAALVRWLGGNWSTDVSSIKYFLREAYERWQAEGSVRTLRNLDALAYLSQQRMAAEMASVLHATVERPEVPLRVETPWA